MSTPPTNDNFVPVPVIFAPSQQRGHDIAVYIFPHDHSLCYEFFFHCRGADKVTETYLCCSCKSLRTKDSERYCQPIPSCKIRDGYFITDPLNTFRAHFCVPKSTPQATARRLIIERCNELRAGPCSKPTRNVVEEILSDITSPKFDAFPMGERRKMVEQIASPYGNARENLRRTLQRNQQRGLNPTPPRPRLTGKIRKRRVRTQVYPLNDDETKTATKQLRLPVHTVPRQKLVCAEPIRTLVFMDLASTHIYPGYSEAQRRISPQLLNEPIQCTNTLKRFIIQTEPSDFPRITEMSLLSVPRDVFVRGQKTIQSLIQEAPEQSFVLRLSANFFTCQVNPELSEEQWQKCKTAKASDSSVVRRARHDLELKRSFAEEWPWVRKFLDDCAKPVCLIAHNGMFFDFRTLYGELHRCGFIEKGMGIPKGVVFVDSTLAIREIENIYCKEVCEATKKLTSVKVHPAAPPEEISESREEVKIHTRYLVPREGPSKASGSTQSQNETDEESCNEHPLSVFNVQLWPAAKMRRIRPEFFRQDGRGRWEFSMFAAREALKDDLPVLYEAVVKTPLLAHFTQDDAEALMQVCVAYGREFQDYIDYKSAHFPF
ncbi:hypothetical protein V3C99_014720 [Haemonchus contortus]